MSAPPFAGCTHPHPAATTLPLAGRHIVVTRPAHQAEGLCAALQAAGGQTLLFPLLSIRAVAGAERVQLEQVLARIAANAFDLAVFVSPNAIHQSFQVLAACALGWPQDLPVAVVGKGSEQALASRGVLPACIIAPQERYDSEGLLALPALQAVAGQQVILLRGDGGRELIATTLRARGATVEYATCYHRDPPSVQEGAGGSGTPGSPLRALQQLWQQAALDALILTSSEGLRHLYALLDDAGRARLQDTQLFVPHARIAEEARRLGLLRVVLTAAGDAGLVRGLIDHFAPQAFSLTAVTPISATHGP